MGDLDNLQNLVANNDVKNMAKMVQAHEPYNLIISDAVTQLTDEQQKIADVKAATDTWANTSILSMDQIKSALVDIVSADSRLSDMILLLTKENEALWPKMLSDLTQDTIQVLKLKDAVEQTDGSTQQMGQHIGLMAKASSMQMLSSAIGGVGEKMTGFITKAISQGADFDNSINNTVVTLNERLTPATQLTGAQVQALSDKVTSLGALGKFSANDISAAMSTMASSGMDYSNIMSGAIKAVQNTAAATDSDLNDTAKIMTNIYNEQGDNMKKYGATTEQQFGHVSDLITNTMKNSGISVGDFNSTLKYTGAVAGGMGLSLDDVATGMTLVGKAGVSGSSAGTYFRQMLTDLAPTTKTATAEMEKLGLVTKDGTSAFYDSSGKVKSLADIHDLLANSVGKLNPQLQEQAMKTMFGTRSLSGLNAMLTTTDSGLNDLRASVTKQGTAQDIANKNMETTKGQLTVLSTNFETLATKIGERFLPIIDELIPMGQKMIDWFNGLSDPMKDMIAGFVAVGGATALGASKVLSFASNMLFLKMAMMDINRLKAEAIVKSDELAAAQAKEAASAKALGVADTELGAGEDIAAEGAVAASGPVGILGGLMVVLTSPITLVIAGIAALGIAFYEAYQHCAGFRDGVNTIVAWLKDFLAKAWTEVSKDLVAAWGIITKDFIAVWSSIQKSVKDAWDYIGPTIMNAVKTISDYWNEIWPEVKQSFVEIWNAIVIYFGPELAVLYMQLSAALGFIKGIWKDAWSIISSTLKVFWDGIVDIIKLAWDVISGLVKVALDLFTGNWGKAWKDVGDIFQNAWKDIGQFFVDLVGNAVTWGKNIIQGFIDGINGMVSQVGQAAANVVNTVKNFLGFHSPAKEGPGSDADKWMPNLINMLADGLNSGVSTIAKSASAMAKPISDVFVTQVQTAQDVWNATDFKDKTANLNLNTITNGTATPQTSTGANPVQGLVSQIGAVIPSVQGQLPQNATASPLTPQMMQTIELGIGNLGGKQGAPTYNITINVSSNGKNGTQQGQDIAKQLRLQMPTATPT
jgi:TP901 family phage tail tape measure protein